MPVTGATFNFNKTITEEEAASTPDHPTDSAKIDTKVAGEKTGKQNTNDCIALSVVTQLMQTSINSAISNIEGGRMQEQARALQSVATSVISNVVLAYTNPYALLANLACKGIERAAQIAKFNREKAWEKYSLEEYRSARGYSATSSRSRNN